MYTHTFTYTFSHICSEVLYLCLFYIEYCYSNKFDVLSLNIKTNCVASVVILHILLVDLDHLGIYLDSEKRFLASLWQFFCYLQRFSWDAIFWIYLSIFSTLE